MGKSLQEIVALAERGRTAYQIRLGNSYLTGLDFDGNPFGQDFAEARRWFERAHEQGAFTATYLLGTLHEEGKGGPVDIPKAIELYQLAVERGAYLPCVNLARIYARGIGVPPSRETASLWYRKVLTFEGEVDDAKAFAEAREYLQGE